MQRTKFFQQFSPKYLVIQCNHGFSKKNLNDFPVNSRIFQKTQGFSKKLKDFRKNSMLRRLPASVGLQKNVQKISLCYHAMLVEIDFLNDFHYYLPEGMNSISGTTGLASSPEITKPICFNLARKYRVLRANCRIRVIPSRLGSIIDFSAAITFRKMLH